jgi:prepilin-type N-terminal cleavage/methylation domain-containing protein
MRQQAGFTLVEIAIVLVIIGLLLGGVLKGQEIITNAKIKNLESDFNGISAAIYSYQDRYRAIPGDDKNTETRWGSTVTKGDGNSKIAAGATIHKFDSTTTGEESRLFWLHLRNAGLVTGAKTSQDQPLNAFGGITGVSNDSTTNGGGGTTIPGLFVGFTQIPGNIAVILETQSDDQVATTGSIRSDQTDYTTGSNGSSLVLHKLFFAL